jgi:hypothetical protein
MHHRTCRGGADDLDIRPQPAQGSLVADLYRRAARVPCELSAVMVGGLPGADKAAVLT